MDHEPELSALDREIIACRKCPRLVAHCRAVAAKKRKAYLDWDYWGRPVPSFGDRDARLLLIGLAPGAHGANRTGRVFTGDSSADFLYAALHESGFASQPSSTAADDGLVLRDCYISCAVRCAPPHNRPTREEFETCRDFLVRDIQALRQMRVVITLGKLAHHSYLAILRSQGVIQRYKDYFFAHGRTYRVPGNEAHLLCSYHPSRQNTQTGRLTKSMLISVLETAKGLFEPCSALTAQREAG